MQDAPVLAQLRLGYSPLIDRARAVVATRVTIFPDKPDAAIDADALAAVFDEVWPPAPAAALTLTLRPVDSSPKADDSAPGRAPLPPLLLNPAGEALLDALLAAPPRPDRMLELPAFAVADPTRAPALQALAAAGVRLFVKGRPLALLPREVQGSLSHEIVDAGAARAPVPPGTARIGLVHEGVRRDAEIEAAFARGADLVLGWPLDDLPAAAGARTKVPPDIQVVLELIAGVDREEPVQRLEATLKRDPTVAFRLMRYLNSPAFGLTVEIGSFGHALMMLGYRRLKRWLALLLASASKAPNAKPLLYAAVRRGLLMEELGRSGSDAEARGEMFICGVFSLLDRLLDRPFAELLASVPVPERVQQALIADAGPFAPFLALVRAIEAESAYDIREAADRLLLAPAEVNRGLIAALAAARQLD